MHGQSAAAVRVLWGAPLLRRFGVLVEAVGWGAMIIGALGVIITIVDDLRGQTEGSLFEPLAGFAALAMWAFLVVVIGRFVQVVTDYMVARMELLIEVDDDGRD